MKCLGKNTSLNSLFVFSDAFDLKELGRVVGHMPNLKHVQFNWMGMDDSALLLMLPAFGRLESLVLEGNEIGHVGATALAKFLLDHKVFLVNDCFCEVFSERGDYFRSLDGFTKEEKAVCDDLG